MIGYARHKLSSIQVVDTGRLIKVNGIDFHALMKDIGYNWETSVLEKYMFKRTSSYSFEIQHFFALDFLYMLEVLRTISGTRVPKRTIIALIGLLKTRTWLSKIEIGTKSIVDMSKIRGLFPFQYKDYQTSFIEHYGRAVPVYGLKGYMLDAGAGTGKTATNLALGKALGVDKVIILALKNSVDEVWRHTIDTLMIGNKHKAWVSEDNLPLDPSKEHFVVHYEYMGKFLEELKKHQRAFTNCLLVVDESHNFNRIESLRTEQLVELSGFKGIRYVNFASGTPILALGNECIPFLRVIDPYFDKRVEERFRKIYGRTAKKANEILRNRIGHLKYHVPKQDVVKVEVTEEDYQVKLKHGEKYTLTAVSRAMTEYIQERKKYYADNKDLFIGDYYASLKVFEKTLKDSDRREYGEYRRNVETISEGFDPRTMRDLSIMCNRYERVKIIPNLPADMKTKFRNAKSVVKYVDLKIMGEALGNIVGRLRTECNVEMLHAIEFDKLINAAEKKTLIFTSYVEVVEEVDRLLRAMEYEPVLVYGDTNKDLSRIVRSFYKDPDLNPMVATLQSLSTAVPITCANRLIYLNQPFRDGLKIQSISRVARLGQDKPVHVINAFLDTGDVPNLSTRSNDIMEWSRGQVLQIVGDKNLDVESLSMESDFGYDDGLDEDSLYEAVYISQADLDPLKLFHYSTIDGKSVYTDSKQAAILGMLRHLTGEQVMYDHESDTYRGSDVLTQKRGTKLEIAVIKPKERDQWLYVENAEGIAGVLYMESQVEHSINNVISSITIDTDTLRIEKVY